jgi:excisionase family DNA binding protein
MDSFADPFSHPKETLTVVQYAEVVGITPRAVRKRINLGRLPAEMGPNGYRIRLADLEAS